MNRVLHPKRIFILTVFWQHRMSGRMNLANSLKPNQVNQIPQSYTANLVKKITATNRIDETLSKNDKNENKS